MLTVLTQNGMDVIGSTSFVSVTGGYVRAWIDEGWYDVAKYDTVEDASIVVRRMFSVMQNGGKVFMMPQKGEV